MSFPPTSYQGGGGGGKTPLLDFHSEKISVTSELDSK